MRDVHSHILPGLDNGPRTMSGSLMMLSAAMQAGVTSIVCTPHCADGRFRFEQAWQAFLQLKHRASAIPGAPQLTMGFEVGYHKLKSLGMDAAPQLGNGLGEFLLELPAGALPLDWSFMVQQLQQCGFKVIIAHPERCQEVQSDIGIARRFVDAGCELQIAAANIEAGVFSAERRTAKKLMQAGLVAHVASEAHVPEDYELFAEAWELYGMAEPEHQPQLLHRDVQPTSVNGKQVPSDASVRSRPQPSVASARSHQGVGTGVPGGNPQPDGRQLYAAAAARARQASPQAAHVQPGYESQPKRGKHAR